MQFALQMVRTLKGQQLLKSAKINDYIGITFCDNGFSVIHLPTGRAILSEESAASAYFFALAVKDFHWDWTDVAQIPEECDRQMKQLQSEVEQVYEGWFEFPKKED